MLTLVQWPTFFRDRRLCCLDLTLRSPPNRTLLTGQISIIARPQEWKAALREIADPDQLSPEYGGTGSPQADLPSLADALYAAGCRGDGGGASPNLRNASDSTPGGGQDDVATERGVAPRATTQLVTPAGRRREQGGAAVGDGGIVGNEACRKVRVRGNAAGEERKEAEGDESGGGGRRGWFGGAWGAVGWWWGGWSDGVACGGDSGMRRDREASGATHDEEVCTGLLHAVRTGVS